MYGYIRDNVYMTTKENDFRNFCSIQIKAKKKYNVAYKNMYAFF